MPRGSLLGPPEDRQAVTVRLLPTINDKLGSCAKQLGVGKNAIIVLALIEFMVKLAPLESNGRKRSQYLDVLSTDFQNLMEAIEKDL